MTTASGDPSVITPDVLDSAAAGVETHRLTAGRTKAMMVTSSTTRATTSDGNVADRCALSDSHPFELRIDPCVRLLMTTSVSGRFGPGTVGMRCAQVYGRRTQRAR